ncbi:hypothetical protein BFP97_18800 [Roseivirga sp. 4D4]|uniref:hypothetical protein n=1 Tax=Roseivirga sp. 4D4 TaxID=1889784 RepID=UPI0008537280|nr:hypothetical protein [Roseivirga sp. 4D4]OEK03442.1 hypothetical protein BFP97_18800 [Roseivirga sp. 4D4]
MKGNKIDELFQKGLSSNKISAPSTAWDQIETQLPTKSKKGIYFWVSIAASILLVFAFGWIMINKSDSEVSTKNALSQKTEVKEEANKNGQEAPGEAKPAILTPEELKPQELVAEATATPEVKEDESKVTQIQEETDEVVPAITLSVANEESIVAREFMELKMIEVPKRLAPKFYISERMAQMSLMIDPSIDLDSFIKSNQVVADLPQKKKRFSLLSGLVTVAKGVNSGKIGLSEMRKSKNDFFNNDLKYGSAEGEDDEDLDDDLDNEDDNLDKK